MYDLKICNGTLVDGTGRPRYVGDLGITSGRLVDVGDAPQDGRTEIDASGKVVSPGFIDIHTHYDVQILWDRMLSVSPWHGVTTTVMGNCGFGIAPAKEQDREFLLRTLQQVEGMPYECTSAGAGDWGFETYPQYLDLIERRGIGINVASMIGHVPMRVNLLGSEADQRFDLTADELARMKGLLHEALAVGTAAFSSSNHPAHYGEGGVPVPSRIVRLAEYEAMLDVLQAFGRGSFHSKRGEVLTIENYLDLMDRYPGITFCDPGMGTVAPEEGDKLRPWWDALEAATAKGHKWFMQYSPLPTTFEIGLEDPFMFALDLPHGAMTVHDLGALFVPLMEKSKAEKIAAYADPEFKRRLVQETEQDDWVGRFWPFVLVNYSPERPQLEGRKLVDIARELGEPCAAIVLDLMVESNLEARLGVYAGNKYLPGVRDFFDDDRIRLGLGDAGAHISQICDARYPTYVLGYWVREQGLALERAIQVMTTMEADAYGIHDRGALKPGLAADVVVFDPDTVIDGPLQRVNDLPGGHRRLISEAIGVEQVIVNGTVIREHGKDTVDGDGDARELPGMLLRDFLSHEQSAAHHW